MFPRVGVSSRQSASPFNSILFFLIFNGRKLCATHPFAAFVFFIYLRVKWYERVTAESASTCGKVIAYRSFPMMLLRPSLSTHMKVVRPHSTMSTTARASLWKLNRSGCD